jgi:hypothetical protein
MKQPRGFAWFPVLFAIIAVLSISEGAYILVHKQKSAEPLIDVYLQPSTTSTPTTDTQTPSAGAKTGEISVAGMTKYTDSEFGFSFWYPTSWGVTKQEVPLTGTDREWDLIYYNIGNHLRLIVRKPMDDGSFFVMSPDVRLEPAARYGLTMGNLASYDLASPTTPSYRTFGVSLNSKIVIFANWYTGNGSLDIDPRPLLKTITPTGTTWGFDSPVEQVKIIQAEKAAYSAASTGTNTTAASGIKYSNSQYGYSLEYPTTFIIDGQGHWWSGSWNTKPQLVVHAAGSNSTSVSVGASTDSSDVAGCYINMSSTYAYIHGVQFRMYYITDPAAGQEGLSHVYRLLKNGTCYQVQVGFVGREISHLSTQAEKDAEIASENKTFATLDAIAQTFQLGSQ